MLFDFSKFEVDEFARKMGTEAYQLYLAEDVLFWIGKLGDEDSEKPWQVELDYFDAEEEGFRDTWERHWFGSPQEAAEFISEWFEVNSIEWYLKNAGYKMPCEEEE